MREIKIISNTKLLTLTTIYTSIHVAFLKLGQCQDFVNKRKQLQTILLKHNGIFEPKVFPKNLQKRYCNTLTNPSKKNVDFEKTNLRTIPLIHRDTGLDHRRALNR